MQEQADSGFRLAGQEEGTGNGTVTLSRVRRLNPSINRYKVLIDGQVVGKIAMEEVQRHTVHPGPHTVQLRMAWARSRVLTVNVAPGETVALGCSMREDTLVPVQLLQSFFLGTPWIELWQVDEDGSSQR